VTEARSLAVAQHEAAHIVVGVALGLRLRCAVLGGSALEPGLEGFAWFAVRRADNTAWAVTLAAGEAWERAMGDTDRPASPGDWALLRRLGYRGRGAEALVTAAAAMLAGLGAVHARVTRGLLERDLTGTDIDAITHGELIEHD
jgi:hypothetical protein